MDYYIDEEVTIDPIIAYSLKYAFMVIPEIEGRFPMRSIVPFGQVDLIDLVGILIVQK